MSAATYPVATIAKLLLLTERRVQQLTRDGVLPKADRGRYELAPAVQGYIRYLRDRAVPGEVEAASDSFQKARARRVAAEASLAEMRAAERKGELLPRAEVTAAVIASFARVRSRLLAVPSRVAPHVIGLTKLAAVQEEIRAAVHEALEELAATKVVAAPATGDGSDGMGEPGCDEAWP